MITKRIHGIVVGGYVVPGLRNRVTARERRYRFANLRIARDR